MRMIIAGTALLLLACVLAGCTEQKRPPVAVPTPATPEAPVTPEATPVAETDLAPPPAEEDGPALTTETSSLKDEVSLSEPISIEYLTVAREKNADPAKPSAHEYMEFDTLLKCPEGPQKMKGGLWYRFVELEVTDDTGRKLAPVTQERVGPVLGKPNLCSGGAMNPRKGENCGRTMLRLPAPDRAAKELVSIRGKVEVCSTQVHHLYFSKLNKLNGEKLSHAKLKGVEVTVFLDPVPGTTPAETVVRLVAKGETSKFDGWDFNSWDEKWSRNAAAGGPAKSKAVGNTLHIFRKINVEIGNYVGLRLTIEEPTSQVETYEFDIRNYPIAKVPE